MSARAVATYDLSGRSGWAVYSPDLNAPVFGVTRMPSTMENGSCGPAFKHLFDHIAWINGRWPLQAIGYEQFIAPTGGDTDKNKDFVTSPATIKKQVGLTAIVEMCADMLDIPVVSINNSSWRKYWLGSQPRGTKRERWKELSKAKARGLGWEVKGDDDADALGQLHWLLNKLEIQPEYGRNLTQELIKVCYQFGLPPHV